MDKHGGDLYDRQVRIDFSVNVNPYGMPAGMRKAAVAGVMQAEQYPDIGQHALKRAVARLEAVDEAQVFCGSGAAELIYAIAAAGRTAAAKREALLLAPSFSEYEAALSAAGWQLSFYTLTESEGFELRDISAYMEMIRPDTGMVWICNPNNPTGTLIQRDKLEQILQKCEQLGVTVVVDECFVDFLDQPDQDSVVSLLDRYPGLIVLKAFTKLYAMPGLRLGYLLCADPHIRIQVAAYIQPWNISLPAQLAGIAAVEEHDYRSESLAYVRAERNWMKQELERIGIAVYGSRANYIFFKGGTGWRERLLAQGLLIRDCSNYRGLPQGYYRIAIRARDENLELLKELEQLWHTDKSR